MNAWAPPLIAVIGTIAGGTITGYLQYWNNKAQRTDAHLRAMQTEATKAVSMLIAAIDRHRAQMWLSENARHEGRLTDDALYSTHDTRGAISEPLTTVRLLVKSLAPAANAAVKATYDMWNSKSAEELKALRVSAITAVDAFIAEAADQFAQMGIGLVLPPAAQDRAVSASARTSGNL
jgi:hypothetical protein